MSDFRIIYEGTDGRVVIVVPAPGITQEQALKDVPTGKKYLIVDSSEIPSDRTFRNAWTADFTNAQVKS